MNDGSTLIEDQKFKRGVPQGETALVAKRKKTLGVDEKHSLAEVSSQAGNKVSYRNVC